LPLSEEDTPFHSPKPPSVHGKEENKIVVEQSKEVFPKVVTKE
jgi:hypothetical protein